MPPDLLQQIAAQIPENLRDLATADPVMLALAVAGLSLPGVVVGWVRAAIGGAKAAFAVGRGLVWLTNLAVCVAVICAVAGWQALAGTVGLGARGVAGAFRLVRPRKPEPAKLSTLAQAILAAIRGPNARTENMIVTAGPVKIDVHTGSILVTEVPVSRKLTQPEHHEILTAAHAAIDRAQSEEAAVLANTIWHSVASGKPLTQEMPISAG